MPHHTEVFLLPQSISNCHTVWLQRWPPSKPAQGRCGASSLHARSVPDYQVCGFGYMGKVCACELLFGYVVFYFYLACVTGKTCLLNSCLIADYASKPIKQGP